MAIFCDVALPIPLEQTFTYRLREGGVDAPPAGARVLVPFRNTRLIGVVTRLHDDEPGLETKFVESVLDAEPILTDELLELAAWVSQYYFCPLGEVLRSMLPLMGEERRQILFQITETGTAILAAAAHQGSSRRSRLDPADQDLQYAVLEYLSAGEFVKATTLRRATGATRELLGNMVRKKWLARETEVETKSGSRQSRFAVMVEDARPPRLNENQLAILAELAGAGGSMPVANLRRLPIPSSTLQTLVKRGLVRVEDRKADFVLSSLGTGKKIHELNQSQRTALKKIEAPMQEGKFGSCLLHGVTGSGKTAVYMAALQRACELGRSGILLVPEIGLTPAVAAQVHAAFGSRAALLHSGLTPEERSQQWRRIRSGEASIVVGTRSAIFAPVASLGIIIVDEEHDSSYKQEELPRYHARDVAVMRGKMNDAAVVLGSATPSLESWSNAASGKYSLIEMKERVNQRPLPTVNLVDMRKEFEETRVDQIFSRVLLEQVRAVLERGEQAIVLLNRRGYSFVVLCRSCGQKLQCENCAIALTYHKPATAAEGGQHVPERSGQRLKCHYCGFTRQVPKRCPECDSEHLFYLGAGSQQGEERLQDLFPEARIGRMDRDTVRGRTDMERLLQRLHSGQVNLLVGTQMIAKGHDIHGVTLVGVVNADHALGMPDFRAAERVFQLLTQVSGRAGRGDRLGQVLVQTYYPEHYAIQCAARHDFCDFAQRELQYRKWMRYPPYFALANLVTFSANLEEAAGWAAQLRNRLSRDFADRVRVLGPAPAPIARIKRMYRFHLLLKAEKRQSLAEAIRCMLAYADSEGIPRRNVIADMDPMNLM